MTKLRVTGRTPLDLDVRSVVAADSRQGEIRLLPLTAGILLLAFGALVAAVLPLIVGFMAIWVTLAIVVILSAYTPMSVFVLNLSTMLGLGLAIDYSLFLTSRFREELRQRDIPDALAQTVGTAGRAVAFSGLTVLIGLAGLLTFDIMFLRSVGVAGVIVVFLAVLGAVTLLPALLAVLGPRIDALRLMPEPPERGDVWEGLARRIMARPWLVFIPTLLLLLRSGCRMKKQIRLMQRRNRYTVHDCWRRDVHTQHCSTKISNHLLIKHKNCFSITFLRRG